MKFKYNCFFPESELEMKLMMGMLDTRSCDDKLGYSIEHDLLGNDWGFKINPEVESPEDILRRWDNWCDRFGRPEYDLFGNVIKNLITIMKCGVKA